MLARSGAAVVARMGLLAQYSVIEMKAEIRRIVKLD